MFSPVTPVAVGPRPSRASTKAMFCGRLLSVLFPPLVCVGLLDCIIRVCSCSTIVAPPFLAT